MVATFPEADLVCLWNDAPARYGKRPVRETWLGRTPLRKNKTVAVPFMIPTWRRLGGDNYEWALVSSHAFAHHARFPHSGPAMRKFVYVHSPARYLWAPELDQRGANLLARLASPALKNLDRRRAREAYAIAANSHFVRKRVERAWQREATVIYPPVEAQAIIEVADWRERLSAAELEALELLPREFILGASRLVPYKGLDLVIEAGAAADIPVVIAGSGPEEQRLRAIAEGSRVPVHFAGRVSDAMLYALYQSCVAYVFPAIEDFGIMPVEAMAAGTAVVGPPAGGLTETIVPGESGVIANSLSATDIANAVLQASTISPDSCRRVARQYDRTNFESRLREWVESS